MVRFMNYVWNMFLRLWKSYFCLLIVHCVKWLPKVKKRSRLQDTDVSWQQIAPQTHQGCDLNSLAPFHVFIEEEAAPLVYEGGGFLASSPFHVFIEEEAAPLVYEGAASSSTKHTNTENRSLFCFVLFITQYQYGTTRWRCIYTDIYRPKLIIMLR